MYLYLLFTVTFIWQQLQKDTTSFNSFVIIPIPKAYNEFREQIKQRIKASPMET